MRLEYQLEEKVWLYMEKVHREHLQHKPKIVNVVSICTLLHVHGRSKQSGWSGFGLTSFHFRFQDCACADNRQPSYIYNYALSFTQHC